jgi:signal transduction histidine kinase
MEQSQIDGERIVRHDVRSPVTSIISGLGLLTETKAPEDTREILEELETDARNMLALLDFSRDLAMLEQGDYAVECRPVNIPTILSELERELDLRGAAASRIVTNFNDRPATGSERLEVFGEPLLVRMLFRSLLRNAVEATPNGLVHVAISDAATPHVTIRNQGVVPESVRARFFEKYVTAGKSRGTGLGTYAAKLAADAHGWEIGFSSSQVAGTMVWVTMGRPSTAAAPRMARGATV